MKIIAKIKMRLGLCIHKGCFRKATLEIKIPQIDYEGQLCDKHFEKLEKMEVFNFKELK
ncbi:MAG: hypothetical protein SPH93_16050 [Clostridium sp.]|uniref:hypothetical protein n=1 Tax=Clostridium sp. TaxID=1506 RepID=UPI002A90B602|nr:hypothetical protein [Clostridium sp.]MDY6229145.1 hypothetical protein [Clostridium sp.]